MKAFFTFLLFIYFSVALWSANPVPYSGKVSINGVNFEGSGEFAFSLEDQKGTTHWRNGSKKDQAITVPVTKGRYTVLLGGQGMNILTPELFLDHEELYLKVRFDNGDGKGLRHLTPDQRITATPRALVADIAQTARVAYSIKAGAVTASEIKNNTITTAQLNEQILKYLKPEVTSSPQLPTQRANIYTGQSLTLSGDAEGKYLTYQWDRNGKLIAGANAKSLQIPNVNANKHNGEYSLTVINDFGSAVTQSVKVEVNSISLYHTVPSASNMEMIWVEPGTFSMGQTGSENQKQVTLSNGYYLGKYEVTQAEYEGVMKNNSKGLNSKPSQWLNNKRPVERVSWEDATVFLSRLNQVEQTAGRLPSGWKYVLPSEAQWEYACRAGTTSLYSWGDDINSSHANYNWDGKSSTGKDAKETVNVGQYPANSWGFFDMHGNVLEWVNDWWEKNPSSVATNPEGPASGTDRVKRGGSWSSEGTDLRSAHRNFVAPGTRTSNLGFRIGFQKIQPDKANPELKLFGGVSITYPSGQAWAEPGMAAHDARDGNLTSLVKVSGTLDVNTIGTYKLTYSVADGAGNQASAVRTVIVASNDLTFVAEISVYTNASVFESKNLKPYYETSITADNNSSAINFNSWWRDESESPNRPWSESNSGDFNGKMKQNFPSIKSYTIEKFSDSNVKESYNSTIQWYNWYHMPKTFKFSEDIFTDAFKKKFPVGTKVRITYIAN